jgi:hypothetical protein
MRRTQSGITLLGFILILAVVGIFIYVGMKVIPMYSEYYSVKQSLKGLALEPGINNSSPDHIRARELDVTFLHVFGVVDVKATGR